jgi:general secretion pathway protein I
MSRRGFSLLEILLALVIFVGSVAVISGLVSLGVRGSLEARRMSKAVLLCESKMSEVVAGVEPLDPVSQATFEDEPGWVWSLEVVGGPVEGLMTITVIVEQTDESLFPVSFQLTRWMRDPDYVGEQILAQELAEAEGS